MVFFLIIALLALPVGAAAKEVTVTKNDHIAHVTWNERASQGDAIFVRVALRAGGTSGGSAPVTASIAKTSGTISTSKTTTAALYLVPSGTGRPTASATYGEFLAGLPLTTREKIGDRIVTVTYKPFGTGAPVTIDLACTVTAKEFPTDTIHLDKAKSAVMNDTSPERSAQSDRFNKIVTTYDTAGVYQQTLFAKPTTGTYITSPFGDRRVYAYSDGTSYTSEHWGIDYRAPEGTPVYACGAGLVVMAENRILTGGTVVVEHLPGLYSCYYHQSKVIAKVGDRVASGDKIGEAGSTGVATGPHIHWEIKLNAQYVNPDFFRENFGFF
jgi:murein DD-endopeptidase MepM/ murein hydrolase activator NlpD